MGERPGITRDEFLERQARTRELADAAGYAGVMVIGRSFYDRPGPLAYLTNHFPPFPATEFDGPIRGLGHGLCILPVDGPTTLIVDGSFYRSDLIVADEVRVAADLPGQTAAVLQELRLGSSQVGLVGEDILPLAFFGELLDEMPDLDLVPDERLVARQRLVKSPAEQVLLREAAEIAGLGLKAAVEALQPGVTERQVCAAGTAAALAAGADFVRYTRVHSGPWSAWPSRWPQATGRVIEDGDIVALDIIGACQGYGFDVLRTTVCGQLRPETRKLLEAALAATERAVDAARAGTPAQDVHQAACQALADAGFGQYLPGFTGHGIGLETVEAPQLRPGVREPLQPGMVLCIEPGIFIRDVGGACVEQEVIVTESGPPELITTFDARLW
ncbi:MAG: aminopeptidase P family protein [Anaerolineae bacterium]